MFSDGSMLHEGVQMPAGGTAGVGFSEHPMQVGTKGIPGVHPVGLIGMLMDVPNVGLGCAHHIANCKCGELVAKQSRLASKFSSH